jgi:uncharacterized repeat protein (TIGR03803 family)
MTHKERSRQTTRPLLLVVLILTFASTASAEWKEKVLYSFQGGVNDGSLPAGGVVFDSQGNLYGATTYGGLTACAIGGECGTIFQLSRPVQKGDPWTEKLIYKFQGQGSNDGGVPSGGLILDAAGNLYGITAYGGSGDCVLLGLRAGCGTVYELSPPKQKGGAWKETILYSFPTAKQGYFPNGNLVFEKSGNLYGATTFGGTKGTSCDAYYGGQCGVVFELTPPKAKPGRWTEQVLHNFAGGTDGANPNGGLVLDSKGNVYGTTYMGGSGDWGTVYQLKPPTRKGGVWTEKQLLVFTSGNAGGLPSAGVIFDSKANLYGTTVGTIFRLAPPSTKSGRWKHTILSTFNNYEAYDPDGALVFDPGGSLYGTTYSSNTFHGTVFRLQPPSRKGSKWTFAILYGFLGPPDGGQPAANLIFDKNGNLYSTTQKGGTGVCSFYGCGTVFEVSP